MKKTPAKTTASPRKRERLTQEDRRAQLLECAIKIFSEYGLDAANHALIAEEAKVSVPTVFFYFNSRENLVDAVLTEVERVHKISFKNANKSTKPANEVLIELSTAMIDTLDFNFHHSRIFLEWSIMARSDIWPRFLKLHKIIINTLVKLIKRGQAEGNCRPDIIPEDEAHILHASSYVMSQMMLTGQKANKIDRYRKSVLETVLLEAPE